MKKIKTIIKGSFAKNVLMLTGGAIFAQAMNFLLSPIITRIYMPAEYGIMTVYNATLGIISLLGALSYELAIPIAEDEDKAINIFSLCVLILVAMTLLLGMTLYIRGEAVLSAINADEIVRYRYLIPVGFFGMGLYMTASNWAFRRKDFKIIAKTSYTQSIAGNFTKIGLGLLSFGPIGLIIGRIIAESSGVVILIGSMLKRERALFKSISRSEIRWVARRYSKFPLFSAPTILITSLSAQVPVIVMASLFGSKVVGFYGLALTVTFLPVTLVGKAVQDVFYGETASMGDTNAKRIKELSDKLLKSLLILGIVPMALLLFWGPVLFSTVFGEAWREAGMYSRILTPYMFSYFIFHPISAVYYIFEQQRRFFYLNIAKLGLVIILFQIANKISLSSYLTVLSLSLSMAFIEFIKYIMAQDILKKAVKKEQ